jgi:predicted SnoaL-like aldol condensation-catalyzing enzyme
MTKEEIKNIIVRVLKSLDEHDPEQWKACYSASLQHHMIGMPKVSSRDEYWHFLDSLNEKYTDFHHTVNDMVAEQIDDNEWKLALMFSLSIRFIATGKVSSGTGMTFFRVKDGKIVEQWDKLTPPQA